MATIVTPVEYLGILIDELTLPSVVTHPGPFVFSPVTGGDSNGGGGETEPGVTGHPIG